MSFMYEAELSEEALVEIEYVLNNVYDVKDIPVALQEMAM